MDGHERLPQDDEGNEAVRQVVQFAALRDVAGNPTALAAKLLQELPGQMLDWFGTRQSCNWSSAVLLWCQPAVLALQSALFIIVLIDTYCGS
jgi:hypothetical protein